MRYLPALSVLFFLVFTLFFILGMSDQRFLMLAFETHNDLFCFIKRNSDKREVVHNLHVSDIFALDGNFACDEIYKFSGIQLVFLAQCDKKPCFTLSVKLPILCTDLFYLIIRIRIEFFFKRIVK